MAAEGFSGMAQLISGLDRLDDRVKQEAASIVQASAQTAKDDVIRRYPRHTGTLGSRVTIEGQQLRWKVRTKAPHAHLFEYGTLERFTKGTGAGRGRMEATPAFVPAAQQARTRMVNQLVTLMVRQTVPGMDGRMEVRR